MLLVGDIGGTYVRLAIMDNGNFVKEKKFQSRHFHGLSEILEKFLDQEIAKACFALAGPIRNRRCKMTNLHWEIDADELQKKHAIPNVHLLNDLEAAGRGIQSLEPNDIVTLNRGVPKQGNRAIVAAGTGLGIGALYWDGKEHRAFATEGGHADFAPRDLQEKQLWDYLHKKYGHVSIERVVSGQGLEHLYLFLAKHQPLEAKLIIENSAKSSLCQETLSWFASLYGAVAGNVALQYFSTGGVYLAGGIAPKILKFLKQEQFMQAFVNKGRFQELLSQIPVYVVLNENLPLLGAINYCKAD